MKPTDSLEFTELDPTDDLQVFAAPFVPPGRSPRISNFLSPIPPSYPSPMQATSFDVTSIVRVAGHTFHFDRENGGFEEKSIGVERPTGAGFAVMVNNLQYGFVRRGTTQLIERPLGEFLVRAGLRGNNIVCGVRLTDSNSDDAVRIVVNVTVLFFD